MSADVPLRRIATLVTDCPDIGEAPAISLDVVASRTGGLVPSVELPAVFRPESGSAVARPGDVLFGKLRPYLAKSLQVTADSYVSTELLALRPNGVDSQYLSYVVRSIAFVDWATATSDGAKMPRTSWSKLREYAAWVPAAGLQHAIAAFLDTETARIDALIAKKRQLRTTLGERSWSMRTALLTPPSGGGWVEYRLRHVCPTIQVGVVVNPSSYFADNGVPFIHGSDVRNGWIDLRNVKRIDDRSNTLLHKSQLCAGDVLVVRAGYPGRAAVVTPNLVGANCASVLILRRGDRVLPEFLAAFFNSGLARSQIQANQYGAAQEQVNVGHVVDFVISLPEVATQRSILDELSAAEARLGTIALSLTSQIVLLQERREALITAAVTGELDIPSSAA